MAEFRVAAPEPPQRQEQVAFRPRPRAARGDVCDQCGGNTRIRRRAEREGGPPILCGRSPLLTIWSPYANCERALDEFAEHASLASTATKLDDDAIPVRTSLFADWPYGINHLTSMQSSPPKMSNASMPRTTA